MEFHRHLNLMIELQKIDFEKTHEIKSEKDDNHAADARKPSMHGIRDMRQNAIQQNAQKREHDGKSQHEEKAVCKNNPSIWRYSLVILHCARRFIFRRLPRGDSSHVSEEAG